MVISVGLFLTVYKSCGSPDLDPNTIASAEEVRLSTACKHVRRYVNIPIVLTHCRVISSFYLHSRGFYFVESTEDGSTLLVITSRMPFPDNSEVKILGKIAPIYSTGDDVNLVYVKESYSQLASMKFSKQ